MKWIQRQRSLAAELRNLERHTNALREKYELEKAFHETALREIDALRSLIALLREQAEHRSCVPRVEHLAALGELEKFKTWPRTGGAA